jgi:anti-sigma factor RsiW
VLDWNRDVAIVLCAPQNGVAVGRIEERKVKNDSSGRESAHFRNYMDRKQQLKIQAYLDGELSSWQASRVARLLESDADARALWEELRYTHNALTANPPEMKLPESREFFWNKIQNQIERECEIPRAPAPRPWAARLVRYFAPLAGVAALVVIAVFSGKQAATPYVPGEVESSDEMAAQVFRSQSERMTVVWLQSRDIEEDSEEI